MEVSMKKILSVIVVANLFVLSAVGSGQTAFSKEEIGRAHV